MRDQHWSHYSSHKIRHETMTDFNIIYDVQLYFFLQYTAMIHIVRSKNDFKYTVLTEFKCNDPEVRSQSDYE